MKICVVGTGYVGLVTGTCFAEKGHEVRCMDIDAERVEKLKKGECPIYEPGLGEMLRRNAAAGRLSFTTEMGAALDQYIQDYVFTDGYAEKSVERRFAEDMDSAEEVCVYAKLPRGFHIPTPVGNYSPDWAIAFHEGTVKHIFFIAETKGTMSSLSLRPIEKAKILCAKKLFNEISTENIKYHDVENYQNLLSVMKSL